MTKTRTETLPAELAEALISHSERQKEYAQQLRARAAAVRQKGKGRAAMFSGPLAEMHRRQVQTDHESEAAGLDKAAGRAELRSRLALEGKLLHAPDGECSDPFYLQQQHGYRLVAMARPAGIVVTE
jgi:hypothetical protein